MVVRELVKGTIARNAPELFLLCPQKTFDSISRVAHSRDPFTRSICHEFQVSRMLLTLIDDPYPFVNDP
jgi:hypothetical protein